MVILMNQLADSEGRTVVRMDVYSDKSCIDAVCINCNKRFTSMGAISHHLKMTAARALDTRCDVVLYVTSISHVFCC
jgi:ribosomal silencing factor RsfS